MKPLVSALCVAIALVLSSPWSIAAPRTPTQVHKVTFSRGQSQAIVSGVAGFDNREPLHNYQLRAKAGQTLSVRLLSGQGRVQLDVYKVGNRGLFAASGGEDTTRFRSKLKQSGEYVVSVYGIKKNARYKISIGIK